LTTKELEQKIYWQLAKQGTYLCFEVMMPNDYRGAKQNERVDLLTYDTKEIWKFYELKISKSDFHSKAKKTFLGNYNYFVMPVELYEQVKDEIPNNIGCYVADNFNCWSIKKAKKQDLQVDEDKLKNAFIQSLSRQHEKYMRLTKNNKF